MQCPAPAYPSDPRLAWWPQFTTDRILGVFDVVCQLEHADGQPFDGIVVELFG